MLKKKNKSNDHKDKRKKLVKEKKRKSIYMELTREKLLKLSFFSIFVLFVLTIFEGNVESSELRFEDDSDYSIEEEDTKIDVFSNRMGLNVLSTESMESSLSYSGLVEPMKEFSSGVECPNMDGGGKNKQCSKGYSEYVFSVVVGKKYYLYIETVAPTIWDNSLWVGVSNADSGKFESCPKIPVVEETLVPHKHVKNNRFLCCPKYLTKNEKKGKDSFYFGCCYEALGPDKKDKGCVLDLEVGEEPLWNMLPRQIVAESNLLGVKLFAREDGVGITRLFLSSTSRKIASDLL